MRYSAAILLAAAIGAHAAPQVNTISQISDGQIQAPPATAAPISSGYAVPSVPAATETEVPSVSSAIPSAPVEASSAPSAPITVAPSASGYLPSVVVPVPVPSANVSVPAVSSVPYANSTALVPTSGAPSASGSAPAASSAPAAPSTPANSGAAFNMVSFAGVAFAVLAYLA